MKVIITDDIQDGYNVTASVEMFGLEWETQISKDDAKKLQKEVAGYDAPKPKNNHMRRFVCPNCRKSEMLDHRKRHWCDCNPRAKFQMTVPNPSIERMVSGLVKTLK